MSKYLLKFFATPRRLQDNFQSCAFLLQAWLHAIKQTAKSILVFKMWLFILCRKNAIKPRHTWPSELDAWIGQFQLHIFVRLVCISGKMQQNSQTRRKKECESQDDCDQKKVTLFFQFSCLICLLNLTHWSVLTSPFATRLKVLF